MRRSRRGRGSGLEFGGSGEDSFVAVVVTKLTGALLFILLLAMVIMALLPKAVDSDASERDSAQEGATGAGEPLQIATPGTLPEAVAGRTYLVALAATGGRGRPHWAVDGRFPEWLELQESTGRIAGTPPKPIAEPLTFRISAEDGNEVVSQEVRLAVLPWQATADARSWWKPHWPVVAWRAWLEQGVGFLVLWLVHLLGMNVLTNLESHALQEVVATEGMDAGRIAIERRFLSYRVLIRLATLSATVGLATWLVWSRARSI
jgi:preprotein translocase subunit SecG